MGKPSFENIDTIVKKLSGAMDKALARRARTEAQSDTQLNGQNADLIWHSQENAKDMDSLVNEAAFSKLSLHRHS